MPTEHLQRTAAPRSDSGAVAICGPKSAAPADRSFFGCAAFIDVFDFCPENRVTDKATSGHDFAAAKLTNESATGDVRVPGIGALQERSEQSSLFFSPKPASGAIIEPPPSLESLIKVCIFRENQWRGGANTHPIFFDDLLLAKIETGESLVAWIRPGHHVLMSEHGSIVQMDFELGQPYYIETTPFWWDCKGIIIVSTTARWRGIPDEAFQPIEGDIKEACTKWRKVNKSERKSAEIGATKFAFEDYPWLKLGNFGQSLMKLDNLGDDTIAKVRAKAEIYEEAVRSSDYMDSRLLADAWCAAFVWRKDSLYDYPITEEVFRRIEHNPHGCENVMRDEIERLARDYRFFHWHIAFPDVFHPAQSNARLENERTGWSGGFDLVLGNPPWERIKLQEKEWFAARRPDIANAAKASSRKNLIAALKEEDPLLFAAFQEASRRADGEGALIRNSGRYPLCGQGDINTYAVFAETALTLVSSRGMLGIVVPDGIANSATTADFFQYVVTSHRLHSMYGFKNERFIFSDVEHTVTFGLLTIGGAARVATSMEFCWLAWTVEEMRDPGRRVSLTAEDIALVNPNTGTCPTFRAQRDAELIKSIYRRVPVLIKNGPPEVNPWAVRFTTMFHMSNDSDIFRTREQLEAGGWTFEANRFTKDGDSYVRLYEGRLGHQFNHRFASESNGIVTESLVPQMQDPDYFVSTQYLVPVRDVLDRLSRRQLACGSGLLGFRRIARDTDIRTSIASFLPYEGASYGWILCLGPCARDLALLCATFNSFAFDYLLRNSLAQPSIPQGTFEQVAAPPPSAYSQWQRELIVAGVLELTYTSWDMRGLASDLGYHGPPFRWNLERRSQIRCELDATYFHLYGIVRSDVAYIVDTFPIIRRKDEAEYGEYRTKHVILEIFDAMADAERTGVQYQTRLDPPPSDPRAAHPPAPANSLSEQVS